MVARDFACLFVFLIFLRDSIVYVTSAQGQGQGHLYKFEYYLVHHQIDFEGGGINCNVSFECDIRISSHQRMLDLHPFFKVNYACFILFIRQQKEWQCSGDFTFDGEI